MKAVVTLVFEYLGENFFRKYGDDSQEFAIATWKIAPKFSILKQQTFNISHSFFESGIQEQLSSVVLAQGLSWGYSRDVS